MSELSKNLAKVAIAYDFDGTLIPGNIQEFSLIPSLGLSSEEFWEESDGHTSKNEMDNILTSMYMILHKAKQQNKTITKDILKSHGAKVHYYKGVSSFFERITNYGKQRQVNVEHYIISSGNKEIIEGTSIAKEFKAIYASTYKYDEQGYAEWPAIIVNYTTKMQYLFRINKGIINAWDSTEINDYVPENEKHIPFTNMIYIGDGYTDIPAMKTIKNRNGTAIAVYEPKEDKISEGKKLLSENRVNYIAEADYSEHSTLDTIVKSTIDKIHILASISQFANPTL